MSAVKTHINSATLTLVSGLVSLVLKTDSLIDFSYRKAIDLILDWGDAKLIFSFENYIGKTNDHEKLFLLLQEKILKGLDTKTLEKLFLDNAYRFNYSMDIISRFIKLLKISNTDYIEKLIEEDRLVLLIQFISNIVFIDIQSIGIILTCLKQHLLPKDKATYFQCIVKLLTVEPEIISIVFYHKDGDNLAKDFGDYIIKHRFNDFNIIKLYNYHCKLHYDDIQLLFQNKYIETAPVEYLTKFVKNTSIQDKRPILIKITESKNKFLINDFIKSFPEYDKLGVMI